MTDNQTAPEAFANAASMVFDAMVNKDVIPILKNLRDIVAEVNLNLTQIEARLLRLERKVGLA